MSLRVGQASGATVHGNTTLTVRRKLELAGPLEAGGPSYLSAASGLVRHGERFWVVADDELHMASFTLDGKPGVALRLEAGTLPAAHEARKKAKPDLEALTLLPGVGLLAFGSGSTPNRRRAYLVPLDANGQPGTVQTLSLEALYRVLGRRFAELNIEGAAVSGDKLYLGQRGNGAGGENALVAFDLASFLPALRAGGAPAIVSVTKLELGTRDDVPLSLTDLSPLPDGRLLFSAAAEDTTSTYHDGECKGSVVGVLQDGKVVTQHVMAGRQKLEGVCGELVPGGVRVFAVNDPDDRRQAASLFEATVR